MKLLNFIAFGIMASTFGMVHAAPFDGTWTIDLRSPAEKSSKAECGIAAFVLKQDGKRVTGDHQMATAGCGRVNEGGEDTVEGIARGNSAELTVTSGRNGEVVRGRATRVGSFLRWKVTEQVKPGEPEGDSGLILRRGILKRDRH
ncbi:hypothetical protein [Polaromonas aquatica]|uniref:hypothetical protein n=1 Tax=Polaromonas aquatica TaxID=332657 RepID=UPI003D658536